MKPAQVAAPSGAMDDASWRKRIAQACRRSPGSPMSVLRAEGADQAVLVEALGRAMSMPVWRLSDLTRCSPRFDALPFAQCSRLRCALLGAATIVEGVPPDVGRTASNLSLAITDPFDADLMAWARTRFGRVSVVLVSEATFDAWLAHSERSLTAMGSVPLAASSAGASIVASESAELLDLRQIGQDHSPAVRFVNSTLYDALKTGASDIHLESDPSGLAVKFRIDGVLTAIRRVDDSDLAAQSISRIKVMAQLDIAERRVPQDGRLQIAYASRTIDVRVSIMPSIHGEDAVLRILDRQHLAQSLAGLTLAKLGFDEPSAAALRTLCRRPHGMLLVTGPTGSGKTTTLYAAISETHQSRDKIITIEDPVEYQLQGVLQIPVNERKGLTFARGLRSILRHDPDKILVGEIRDAETAQIAVQSALTGHLVFTTVHANTVFDVVGRFGQFGIDAYTFASAINGVLAQRLFRRVCAQCAVDDVQAMADAEVVEAMGRRSQAAIMRKAMGCEHCRGTGYAGRFALGELLHFTPALRALLSAQAPQGDLQAEAQRGGWRSLREMAMDAVVAGLTTREEVNRVAL